MKIAVVAANGRSGRAFVQRALSAGHTIRAGVHTTHSFLVQPGLEIVTCDATNEAQVSELIAGQDAVVSFIGHGKHSPAHVQRDAMQTLVAVMAAHDKMRIISLTGTGVRFAGDKIGFVDRFLNASIALIDPRRIRDGIDHVEVLKASTFDWTIVRVLKFQSFQSRPFILTEHGPTRWFVNRDEVARAVLQLIDEASFIHAAPMLSRI